VFKKDSIAPLTYYVIQRDDGRIELLHNTVLHSVIMKDTKYEILACCESRKSGLKVIRDIINERYSDVS